MMQYAFKMMNYANQSPPTTTIDSNHFIAAPPARCGIQVSAHAEWSPQTDLGAEPGWGFWKEVFKNMMTSVLKMMNSVLKMMNPVLKIAGRAGRAGANLCCFLDCSPAAFSIVVSSLNLVNF